MDCPKKGCDGQVEAWFKIVNFCGVGDEGNPDYVWNEKPSVEIFEKYQCSQCSHWWINKQQLLADKGERIAEQQKGGEHP